jgi:hypothetical protein
MLMLDENLEVPTAFFALTQNRYVLSASKVGAYTVAWVGLKPFEAIISY